MNFIKNSLILGNILFICADAYPSVAVDLTRSNIIAEPSMSAGESLSMWSKGNQKGNPEEQGPYFEGDIIISDARNGVRLPGQRWPNATIPYAIEGFFSKEEKNMLSDAIDEIKLKTCIKIVPRVGEKDYIVFKSDKSGCWSSVGRSGGAQIVNLQSPCLKVKGTAIHEILHASGFYHEQNRSDREKYVSIKKENIPKDKFINFEMLLPTEDDNFGVSYDYGSVLHYSPTSFSMNGKPTIESKGDPATNKLMGQRIGLSDGDIKKVNRMYNCNK